MPADQNETPYLKALREYAARDPARLHVPGHKGGAGADPELLEAFGERALQVDIPALTYGIDPRFPYAGGAIPIEQSAPELADFVHMVLAATKTTKIDLVGHSEGTFMPQYWLKFLGGAPEVNRYVAMTPLYAGTGVLPAVFDELGAGRRTTSSARAIDD